MLDVEEYVLWRAEGNPRTSARLARTALYKGVSSEQLLQSCRLQRRQAGIRLITVHAKNFCLSKLYKYKTYVKQIVYVFYTSNKAASQIGKEC
jgi:hypothetical protein